MSQGTVVRVADQLGYGPESVRRWVAQAEIDAGGVAGISTAERAKMKKLEQENRELRRANEILKRASAFFAGELDCPQKEWCSLSMRIVTILGLSLSARRCR